VNVDPYTLYRPSEVSAITGISVASVYRLIRSGRLGFFEVESERGAVRCAGLHVEQLLASELSDVVEEAVSA
jgi:hypothetical protein